MANIFTEFMGNIWVVSVLILAVILLRCFIKKVPRTMYCVLWGMIFLRMILPLDIHSIFSLLPDETEMKNVTEGISPIIVQSGNVTDSTLLKSGHEIATTKPVTDSMVTFSISDVLCLVWMLGVLMMLLYLFLSYWKMQKKVSQFLEIEERVRLCDEIASPFLFGIIKPYIYLPSGLKKEDREYVISHEQMHIKRKDNIWKLAGFIALSVYWFHPLCWVAYILFCKDIELACDEMVIKRKTAAWRANYCQVLLDCSTKKRGHFVTMLAFGEVGVKQRVKHVMKYKKAKVGIIILSVLICVFIGVCFGTKPNERTIAMTESVKKDNTGKGKTEEEINPMESIKDVDLDVKVPRVDLSASTGADGARLYYADKDTIIFGGYFGLFVYDTKNHRFFRSVDLSALNMGDTQGDNAYFIETKEDGKEVYLYQLDSEEMYVFYVNDNIIKKEKKNLDEKKLFTDTDEYTDRVFYKEDSLRKECVLVNAQHTIGELGYRYVNTDDKVYPLFVEESLQGASFCIPRAVTSLVKAEITYQGKHYVCTDKTALKNIEYGIADGKKQKGLSGCPFDNILYLTKEDGSVKMLIPAMDGCNLCLFEDGMYELNGLVPICIPDMIEKGIFIEGESGNSTLKESVYTKKDIDAAINVIREEIKSEWKGCTLAEIYYAGDEVLQDYQEWLEEGKADEVMVLESTLQVDASGGDGSLNANSIYSNWKWILVREKNGEWRHVDHGN